MATQGTTSNVTNWPCRFWPHGAEGFADCKGHFVSDYYRNIHERFFYEGLYDLVRPTSRTVRFTCKVCGAVFEGSASAPEGLTKSQPQDDFIAHLGANHLDAARAKAASKLAYAQAVHEAYVQKMHEYNLAVIGAAAAARTLEEILKFKSEGVSIYVQGVGAVPVDMYLATYAPQAVRDLYAEQQAAAAVAAAGATIAGIVRGVLESGTQVNLGGATVTVENLKSAVTASNGQYGVSGIPVGTYNWTCSAPGYLPETGTITVGMEHLGRQILLNILIRKPTAETPIWVPPEEEGVTELDPWLEQPIAEAGYGGINLAITARAGPSLSPVVYINGTKVPYPAASTPNYSPVGSPYGTAVLQKSNTVKVTALGYKDAIKQINFTDDQWDRINAVTGHAVYEYVISLTPVPNSTYTVVPKLDTGQILNVHVEIVAHDAGHNFAGRVEGTGPTGFEGWLSSGTTRIMTVLVSPPVGAVETGANTFEETIRWPAKITRNVIFKLKDPLSEPGPGPAQVYGQVRDFKTGIGIGDVRVLVESWGARPETRTAANGNWGFKDVPVGSYRISFSKGGYCEKLINVTVSGSDVFVGYVYMEPVVSLLGGDLDPQWRYGAKGYVRNSATHAGIGAADVYLDGFHVQTDGNGFWSVQPGLVQPGDYRLTVKKAGFLDASAMVPIPRTDTGGIFQFDVYMQPVSVPPTLPWADPKPPEIPLPGQPIQEPIRTPSEPVFEPDVTQPGQDRTGPDVVEDMKAPPEWGFEFTSFAPEKMDVQTLLPILVAIGIAAGAGTYYAARKRRRKR